MLIVSGIELKDGKHRSAIREIEPGMDSTVGLITTEDKPGSAKIFNVFHLIPLHPAMLSWWIHIVAEFQGGLEKIGERIFGTIPFCLLLLLQPWSGHIKQRIPRKASIDRCHRRASARGSPRHPHPGVERRSTHHRQTSAGTRPGSPGQR
jgi:hypothetical protein